MAEYKLLTKDIGTEGLQTLPVYERRGGYQALRTAVTQRTPDSIIEEVKTSGLRGRGGAGFPTGTKWSFLPRDVFPRYLCINADESEPGCFKDRYLIDENPHQLVEGILIAAYALQVKHAFLYIRGEYHDQRLLLERCVEEARRAGYIGDHILGTDFGCDVIVHGGAGAYICGEETALIDSLEGYRGQPRLKPPFPAVKGLYGKPTVVNNVETLSNLPHIVTRGGEWFKSIGAERSTGTRVWCCSGHIESARLLRDGAGEADPRALRGALRGDVEGSFAQGVPARRRLDAGAPPRAPRPPPRHGRGDEGGLLARGGGDDVHGRDHMPGRRLDAAGRLLPPRVPAGSALPAAREPTSRPS